MHNVLNFLGMSNVNGQGGFVSWMNFPKTCLKPVLLQSGLEHNLV